VYILIGEEIEQLFGLFAHAGVLLDGRCFEQVVVEPFLIYVLADVSRVYKDEVKDSRIVAAGSGECVEGLFGSVCHHAVTQLLVLMVHIPHVTIGTAHGDSETRIERCQLQHGRAHGENTAVDNGAVGIDEGIAFEYFREALHHALGNSSLLSFAISRQVAPATF